jgi:hypothetical protein
MMAAEPLEFVLRSALIGIGATMVMDGWALFLRRLGIPSLDLALLGRWLGHLRNGQWKHVNIAGSAPVRGEAVIGWCAHYSIGNTVYGCGLYLAARATAWLIPAHPR